MIVEYAQNEILISPLSPRTNNTSSSAPFRPHPYHAGRSTMMHQVKLIPFKNEEIISILCI